MIPKVAEQSFLELRSQNANYYCQGGTSPDLYYHTNCCPVKQQPTHQSGS